MIIFCHERENVFERFVFGVFSLVTMRVIFFILLSIKFVFGSLQQQVGDQHHSGLIGCETEIAEIINSMMGKVGSKIDLVRLITTDENVKHYFLSLGHLEVEAFEIITANPSSTDDEIVELLNSQIDVERTVSQHRFDNHRLSFWRHMILKLDDQESAAFISENTEIHTLQNGISYLQFSDKAWDTFATIWLANTGPRKFPPLEMPNPQLPKRISDFDTMLTPTARQFVHQRMSVVDLSQVLTPFDTRSVLFRNMKEYLLTVRSFGLVDLGEVLEALCESPTLKDLADLAVKVNSKFNTSNPPAMNILYTSERLNYLLLDGALVGLAKQGICKAPPSSAVLSFHLDRFKQIVLDSLNVPGLPPQISPEMVVTEWNQFERDQGILGPIFFGVNTEIGAAEYDPNFTLLAIGDDTIGSVPPRIKTEAEKAILEFLCENDMHGLVKSRVRSFAGNIAVATDTLPEEIIAYAMYMAGYRVIHGEIAKELARINKLRIKASPETILEEARYRGVSFIASPKRVSVFYKLMVEAIRTHPDKPPFRLLSGRAGELLAIIDNDIWKDHFGKPRLKELSS